MSGAASAGSMMSMASTGLMIAGTLSQASAAGKNSQANQDSLEYQASVTRNNAQLAEWQAADAYQRGVRNVQGVRMKAAQTRGSQRARLAANGVALDEGSALNILDDTDFLSELDARDAHDNAAKEAWGYQNQARGYGSDASMLSNRAAAESPNSAMLSTLLTGAGTVASSWYNRTRVKPV